jgi:hypothetical protein
MLLPKLSDEDPAAGQEGTIDPLGLYSIADDLAIKLIPGVRERQRQPRFLTASAVSLSVCSAFDPDVVATDNVTEPRMVFEWYLVEGLARTLGDTDEIRGLPGRDKAARALRDKVPLSVKRYLKTPTVFGFHGVYRLLARNLGIEVSGQLGPNGYALLDVWRREQGLRGFFESVPGEGTRVHNILLDAVKAGLARSSTDRSPGWEGWQFFADHLAPHQIGKGEAGKLWGMLLDEAQGFRREVLEFLVSATGRKAFTELDARWNSERVWDERPFHRHLAARATGPLRTLLAAIDAYERFARLLQDAFDDCLYIMSRSRSKVRAAEMARSKRVVRAAVSVPASFRGVAEALATVGLDDRFDRQFAGLAERCSTEEWVGILVEHHRKVQAAKLPNPKAPWFERFDDSSCVIRPRYLRDRGGLGDETYVHSYRTGSLRSFARELGMVN